MRGDAGEGSLTERGRAPAGGPFAALAAASLSTLFFAGYAVLRGQDANWDFRNYHAYAGYALLHWRFGEDVAPGDIQTFFNPLPYAVPYLLRRHLPAVVAAGIFGAVQSLVLWVAWGLTGAVIERRRVLLRAAALALMASGAVTLSEVGTSFCDLLLTGLILGSLLALVQADAPECARPGRLLVCSGLLMGAATGLKLTNVVFAAALAAAAWPAPWRRWCGRLSLVACGGLLGFLLTDGWWGAYLWARFGNPAFPMYNAVLRLPDAQPNNFTDPTYVPLTLADALSRPFRWALGEQAGMELAFRDGRCALALMLIAAWCAALLAGRASTGPVRRIVVFFFAGGVAWLGLFGNARYALPLEMLAGLLIPTLGAALLPGRVAAVGVPAMAAAVIAWTQVPDWGHRAWAARYAGPGSPAALQVPASFLLLDNQLSYLAEYFPPASRFYRLSEAIEPPTGQFIRQLVDGLRAPMPGGSWMLTYDDTLTRTQRDRIALSGMAPGAGCLGLNDLAHVRIMACPLSPHTGGPALPQDRAVLFSTPDGWAFLDAGWSGTEPGGTWAVGTRSTLLLNTQSLAGNALRLHVLPAPGLTAVAVRVDGQDVPGWRLHGSDGWADPLVCLPPDRSSVQIDFLSSDARSPASRGTGADSRELTFMLQSMQGADAPSCSAH